MTIPAPASENKKFDDFFWPLILLGLAPWIMQQFGQSMNSDTAFLTIGAQRLLAGQSMAAHIYDNNPPLGLIFHIPIIWLSKLGVPVYYGATLYFGALLSASAAAIHTILKRWNFLSRYEVNIITASYILTVTILSHVDFGQRDHVLAFGLFPFVLLQISMTYGMEIPARLKWPVLILGVFAVLLKPPHGLLPTLLLLHRALRRKDLFSVLRDPDFICLAAGTLLYGAVTGLFFRDYAAQILPDMLTLYLPGLHQWLVAKTAFYAILIAVMILTAYAVPMPDKSRSMIAGLYVFALISLIPFMVQMQGFHYHLMPALTFFSCALFLSAYHLLCRVADKTWASFGAALLCFAFTYGLSPLNPDFPRHGDYRNFAITREVQACGAHCSFFIFTTNNAIAHTTAIYTGKTHASRFPAYWFLPKLLAWEKSGDPRLAAYKEKFARMAAEDLAYYKPELLLIGRFEIYGAEGALFDLIGYFSPNKAFRDEITRYEKTGTMAVNLRDYFAGTSQAFDNVIEYDIYKRKGMP